MNETRIYTFDENEFTLDSFNVNRFIDKLNNNNISLYTLKKDLSNFEKVLNHSIVSVLNHDYEKFLSLPSVFDGAHTVIESIISNIDNMKFQVDQLFQYFNVFFRDFENNLKFQKVVKAKINIFSDLLYIVDNLPILEKYIKQINIETSSSSLLNSSSSNVVLQTFENQLNQFYDLQNTQSTNMIFERIAFIFFHIHHLLPYYLSFDIIQNVVTPLNHLEKEFENILSQKFKNLFSISLDKNQNVLEPIDSSIDSSILLSCLHSYIFFQKTEQAHLIIQNLFNQLLSSHISKETISSICFSKNPSPSNKLVELYENILSDTKLYFQPFFDIISQHNDLLPYYSFDAPIIESIINELINNSRWIFSLNDMTQYVNFFHITQDFLDKMAKIFKISLSSSSLSYLHQFFSKWNLPVYFNLFKEDIISSFNFSISEAFTISITSSSFDVLSGNVSFHYSLNSLFYSLLFRCFDSKYFIQEIFDEYFKLSFLFFSKFHDIFQQAFSQNYFQSFSTSSFIFLFFDLNMLCDSIKYLVFPHIISILSPHVSLSQLSILYHDYIQLISDCLSQLQNLFVKNIVKQCLEILSHPVNGLKSIKNQQAFQYKSSFSKPLKSSHYLQNFLQPLCQIAPLSSISISSEQSIEKSSLNSLPFWGSLLDSISKEIIKNYSEQIKDFLNDFSLNQELSKSKYSSLVDIYYQQIYVDIKSFHQILSELNIQHDMNDFKDVLKTINKQI